MHRLKLDTVLLFVLIIPFIMGYRISPFTTQYWYFGVIFFTLLSYLSIDFVNLKEKLYTRAKMMLLLFIIVITIGGAFSAAIATRHTAHPTYMIHDIILQQEAAIRYLLDGKNPYKETYFGTFLEQWHYSDKEVNPALYHFVMEPFYLLFALPFYFLSTQMFGYFDGRIPLLFLFFCLLLLATFLVKDSDKKRLFVIILAFHPAMLAYTLEGRSDMFMFPFFFAGLFLLERERYSFAGILVALAFAIKQSVWPFFPFYAAYLFFKTKSFKKTGALLIPFTVTFLTIVVPFFLWDQKAFIASTISYLSGSTPHSYPISGYGFGMVLKELGFIKDIKVYYPFIYWQLFICAPLLVGLLYYLKKTPSVGRLIIVYGIFLFVYWYLSRYFNNSHLAYLSIIFLTAYFWPDKK